MEGRVRKFGITKKYLCGRPTLYSYLTSPTARIVLGPGKDGSCHDEQDLVVADAKSLPDTDTVRKAFVEHPKAAFA